MYVLNGREVSEADFLADELAFEQDVKSYIRPVYRAGCLMGFAVYVGGEAIGRVYDQYKHAALLLTQYRNGELT